MAYSRNTKERALALYIAGKNRQQIADDIKVDPSTVQRWYEKHDPRPWDQARAEVEEKTRQLIVDRLAKEREKLGMVHFTDLEELRMLWRNALDELKDRPVRTTEEAQEGLLAVEPAPEGDEERDFVPLDPELVLTPLDLQRMAGAYTRIQQGQRLVFGQEAYVVGVRKGDSGMPEDIPAAAVAAIEEALSQSGSVVEAELDEESAAE